MLQNFSLSDPGTLRRYLAILENIEGRVQQYYYKREPRQLIPLLVPSSSLNSIVLREDRSAPLSLISLPFKH